MRFSKKTIRCVLLTVSLLLLCSGATAGQHYEIQGVFKGKPGGKIVSFDLYESNGELITVSSLFSETAIVKSFRNNILPLTEASWIFDITPALIFSTITEADRLTQEWITLQKPKEYQGVFSGDLFDNASDMKSCEYSLSGYTQYILDHIQTGTDNNSASQQIIRRAADILTDFAGMNDPIILISTFQEDRYMTILVKNQDDIMMTLSFDRESEEKHALISYRTEGRYCFRDIRIRNEDSGLTLLSSVYTGSSSAYPMYTGKASLFTESVRLTDESGRTCDFNISFETDKLNNPLIIQGSISGTKNGYNEIYATVKIDGDESVALNLSLYPEEMKRDVSFTDKTIYYADKRDEEEKIRSAVTAGVISLASEIIPFLPADYQNILFNLLLN